MHFTLRQLEAFLAVASEGSVSAAAARLGVSQVAVSGLISGLEAALSVPLLERKRGMKASYTHDGLTLAPLVKTVMSAAGELAEAAKRLSANEAVREYCIGGRPYLVDKWLRDIVTTLQVEHSDRSITLTRASNQEIFAGLINGDLSIGLFMNSGDLPALQCRRIGARSASLYVRPTHPLAGKPNLSPDDLNGEDFIYPPAGSAIERSITERLRRSGVGPVRVVARTEFADAILLMARSGVGIGLLFDVEADAEVKSGRLARLDFPIVPVEFWIATCPKPDDFTRQLETVLEHHLSRMISAPPSERGMS